MALAKVVLIMMGAPLVAFAWARLCELTLAGIFLLIAYSLTVRVYGNGRAAFP